MRRKTWVIAVLSFFLLVLASQAQWTTTKRLTWNSGMSSWPAVAVDSKGYYHLVWSDDTPGTNEIYYKKSLDGGTTWSANKRLTWTATGSHHPRIRVDSLGHLHVIWDDYTDSGYAEVFYRKSTDGGSTWTASKRLTWNSGSSERPVIGIDSSDRLHAVWQDDTPGYPNSEIYYKRSTDGGSTWSASERLTWTSDASLNPALAIDSSDRLHLFWSDGPVLGAEIYYKKSWHNGATWSASQRLTWTSGDSSFPAVTVDPSGHIQLAWEEDITTKLVIYYMKSPDGGAIWTKSKRINWTPGSAYKPALAADPSGNIHVVWSDDTPGHPDIYYEKSSDGGATWSAAQRITWTSGNSFRPAVVVDLSNSPVVVWDDYTPGNLEIYFKQGK